MLQNSDQMDETRFRELENRVNRVENDQIIARNNAEFAKEKVGELSKQIENLRSGIHRLVWTAGGLVLVAIVNFILKGGLAGAGV